MRARGYNPENDVEYDNWSCGELILSVNSYNGGPKKLRFTRLINGKYLRGGPLVVEEVAFLKQNLGKIIEVMTGEPEGGKKKRTKRRGE